MQSDESRREVTIDCHARFKQSFISRLFTPEPNSSKETQTDINFVGERVYDEMVRYSTNLKQKVVDLEVQLEIEKKAFDLKTRECDDLVRKLAQIDEKHSTMETSLKQKIAEAEARYADLEAKGLETLQEKNMLIKDQENYLEKKTMSLEELLEKERNAFHDKITEFQNLMEELARKEQNHAIKEKKLLQKVADVELKYANLKKKGLAMLEEKNVLIKNQEQEIFRKTEELDCSRKEFIACDTERRALLEQQEQKVSVRQT